MASAMLMGGISLTMAMPAAPNTPPSSTCCCCDISRCVISCTRSIEVLECLCQAVECPDDAPTVFQEIQIPEPTQEAPSDPTPSEEVDCCCCDISQPAISCKKQAVDEGCFCPFVLCPTDAPTIYPESTPLPTSTAVPVAVPEPVQPGHDEAEEELVACCCCDISKPAISCKMQAASEGCICALVVCPPEAPTVWPGGVPTPTTSPATSPPSSAPSAGS